MLVLQTAGTNKIPATTFLNTTRCHLMQLPDEPVTARWFCIFFSRIKHLQLLLHIDTNAWVKEAEHGDDVTSGESFSATVWCNFHDFGYAAFMVHTHCKACTAKHLFELDMWENMCFKIFSLGHLWWCFSSINVTRLCSFSACQPYVF